MKVPPFAEMQMCNAPSVPELARMELVGETKRRSLKVDENQFSSKA
jgi:hypothetical protein